MARREARILEVRKPRVVDGFANLDRYRIAARINDDLARPHTEDGITGDTPGREDFRFRVPAGMQGADRRGVMECGIHIDAARVVQLVHVAHLPEGAVRQPLQLSQICEPVQVVSCNVPFPRDSSLGTFGQ